MIEFKVVSMNPETGKESVDYELFTSVESAKKFDEMHTDVHVDFDSMIDWNHSENKYEYDI